MGWPNKFRTPGCTHFGKQDMAPTMMSYISFMGLCLVDIPFPTNPQAQQDLMTAGQQQQPSAIFSCLWRYADRFQPTDMDLDAALNALAKCTRRPSRVMVMVFFHGGNCRHLHPIHSSHQKYQTPRLGTPERDNDHTCQYCSIG